MRFSPHVRLREEAERERERERERDRVGAEKGQRRRVGEEEEEGWKRGEVLQDVCVRVEPRSLLVFKDAAYSGTALVRKRIARIVAVCTTYTVHISH